MLQRRRTVTSGLIALAGCLLIAGAGRALAAGAVAVVPVPVITPAAGMVEVQFPLDAGKASVLIPDDIAAGEPFSGTFEAPKGYVLTQGTQRARAGTFAWRVPTDVSEGVTFVLKDGAGLEKGRVNLRTPSARQADVSFRFPALVQEGRTFPVHGPFDGNLHTTKLRVGGAAMRPIVESVRKAVVRAPARKVGVSAGVVRDAGHATNGSVRSVSVELTPATDIGTGGARRVTVAGLAGFTRDVPVEVGFDTFFVRAEEIPRDGTISVERRFRGGAGASASLMIPQSRRDEVELVLRAPLRDRAVPLPVQHAAALKKLDFDPLTVSPQLFADPNIGGDAVFAMLALDETRALPLIFETMPETGLSVQLITFDYFISRPAAVRTAAAKEAREAARRVLARILSSTNAELALYILGLTGTDEDVPLLEKFYARNGLTSLGLRDASEAALIRLGSRPHLERLQAELRQPLPAGSSYSEGVRTARALRKAGFAGKSELLPLVCGHVDDRRVGDIDVFIEPGQVAQNQLAAILGDAPMPPRETRRTAAQWRAYCEETARR